MFTTVLEHLNGGMAVQELTERLREVVNGVKQTGKAGQMSLTIHVKPADKNSGEVVLVTDKIQSKVPEHDRRSAVFYVGEEGLLHREDPRQQPMFDKEGE